MNELSKKQIGDLGEELAARFLTSKGYKIVGRNYLRKWGEIDLVAQKEQITHFVEVKTFSRETHIDPEDNVHPGKLKRLHRAMQSYIEEFHMKGDTQLNVVSVKINIKDSIAKCRIIENVL